MLDELLSAGEYLLGCLCGNGRDVGIDFSDIENAIVEFFLYDHDDNSTPETTDDTGTRVTIGLMVEGTNLELMFQPFGIGVSNGTASLGYLTYSTANHYYTDGATVTNVDFATFTLGIDQQSGPLADDGRFYLFEEEITANLDFDLVGGFDIMLPIQVPGLFGLDPVHVYTNNAPPSAGYGDEALLEVFRNLAGSPTGTADPVIVDLPDLTLPEFSLLSILNDPTYILDGIDFALGGIQEVFGSSFASDLPLVGDKLAQAATFIRDMRLGFLADLRERLNGPGAAIQYIRDGIWDVFGPSGLNIIRDTNNNGSVQLADIEVGWYDVAGNLIHAWVVGQDVPQEGQPRQLGGPGNYSVSADAIQFNVMLGGLAFGTGVDIPLDIDLPGFGLNVDGGFGVQLAWSFDFGMGLSLEDGFYLTTNDSGSDPEIEVELSAFLDGKPLDNAVVTPFVAEGKLLFFKLTAVDTDRQPSVAEFQPSGVFGFLDLNISGDVVTGRLTFNHLLSTPFEDLFDVNMGVDAELNIEFTLELDGVDGLPKLKADFVLDWGWSLDSGSQTPEIGLQNLRLEIGSFVSEVLKPISDKIHDILGPVKPVIDVLLTPIPGLDILLDEPNLLGLINFVAKLTGNPEIPPAFIHAAKNMIDLAEQVNAMLGTNGDILLGNIAGLGTPNASATQAVGSIPQELQSFLDSVANASIGGELITTGVSGGGSSTERSGFKILPYLTDIGNWMKLITGGDATLFTYEMPLLEYSMQFRQQIASITAGPVVINVYVIGGFSIAADLGFGYDTFGIKRAIQTGNPWEAFDGFYFADWGITSGKEKDELTFGAEIGIEAALWLLLVEAGLGGKIGFETGLDMQDINDDGKIRISEMITMWNYTGYDAPGGLLNLINLKGRAYAEAYVFVDVGISIPFVGKIMKRVVDWTLFDITLAEWEYKAPKVQPVLAHDDAAGTLVLHTASAQVNGNISILRMAERNSLSTAIQARLLWHTMSGAMNLPAVSQS